ncbi:MAG: hypothetical protein KatS3mg002_0225 [Candidatus Woesearchaeota archaeon]|nr:MAG: hypothetical protein KatS3mg002_0225 [Candidatus Woesearchaeota archaeon]
MKKLIPVFYKNYGKYINAFRAIPYVRDGCKPVERRVLLSAYEIARNKTIKSARLDGHVIGHYHPHGSVYGTIVNLVHQGFLDGQGNFGTKIGVEPLGAAASRYTEVKLSELTKKLAFKYIDYVDYEESELDPEPKYLPTMIPFSLLGETYTIGLGFGYRTVIPVYELKDLIRRLLFLLKKRKEIVIKPKSHGCEIIEEKSDIYDLLKKGQGKITYKGKYKTIPSKYLVELYSWPPHLTFENILNKLNLSDEIAYRDISSSGKTVVLFEIIKKRNRDDIFNRFIKNLDEAITDSFSYEMNFVDDNYNIIQMGVDDILLITFENYKKIIEKMAKSMIDKYIKEYNELELLMKIRPYLRNYMKNNSIEEVDEVAAFISSELKIPIDTILNILNKYKISKLFKHKDLKEVEDKIKHYTNILNNIDDTAIEEYMEVMDGS